MFAERTFHICEANISPRSDFTCPNGQISLGDLLYSRSPKGCLFWCGRQDLPHFLRYAQTLEARLVGNADHFVVQNRRASPPHRTSAKGDAGWAAELRSAPSAPKKAPTRDTYHKAGFTFRTRKKEYERFVRTPFHMPCPARYSVLHL